VKRWSTGVANVRRVIDEADEPRRRGWVGDTVSNAVTRVGDGVGGRVESASRSVVDDLEPYLTEQTVPAVIEGVLPMVRAEVVPAVLDDVVDDPKVRDLIREQSQGLATHLPPGRVRSHAGAATRLVALGIDLGLVSLVAVQGLTAVVAVLSTVVSPVPAWLVGSAAFVSAGLAPIYFTVSWWLAGRTFGGNLAGFVVCAQDGEQLRFRPAAFRALVGVVAVPVWVVGMSRSSVDNCRRGWLDLLTRTRTPSRVHEQVRAENLATAVRAS
jgi:hypothetical protein